MRKLYIFTLGVIAFNLFTLVNAQETIIHDPNARSIPVENFSAIDISGGIDLYLSQGAEAAVAVSASEASHRDRIRAEVKNGELKISVDGKGWAPGSGNKKLKAYVSVKSINKLTASGACNVFVDGTIKGNELVMQLSGACDFKGKVDLNKLTLNQSGASDVSISGKASNLDIKTSGASDVKGYDLEADNCVASASGASDIKVTVNKEMVAKASGASSISFKGAGVVKEIRTSGASRVNKRS